MTELLDKRYRDQLVTWFGLPCNFQFLYKINTDGCSAETFQQKCDGQGPTILYNTNNTIFGGYLSQSWNSIENFINDNNAFLFRLQYDGSSSPMKFPVINATYAGHGGSINGPIFGQNSIYTFSNTINNSGGYFQLNGSFDGFGGIYDIKGQTINSFSNNNLRVTDLEVYKIEGNIFLNCQVFYSFSSLVN